MFCPLSTNLVNVVALQLARQGRPEKDALVLTTDPRRKADLEAVLKSAKGAGQGQEKAA